MAAAAPLTHHDSDPPLGSRFACQLGEGSLAAWNRWNGEIGFSDKCSGCIAALCALAIDKPDRWLWDTKTGRDRPMVEVVLHSLDPNDPAYVLFLRALNEKGIPHE
jgi:hypothetical protein